VNRFTKPTTLAAQLLVCCLLVCCAAQRVQAAYDYRILGDGGLLGGFNVNLDTVQHDGILVGGIHLQALPGAGVPGYSDFTTLCVDLNGSVYIGSTYKFDVVPFAGQMGLNPNWGIPKTPPNAGAAFEAINNAAFLYSMPQPTTPLGWATLQLAVWKAIYDTDASGKVTGSRFTVTSDPTGTAWSDAQSLINSLNSNGRPTDYVGYLLSPEDQRAQELLIGTTPVPEPATIIGGILLLIPMGLSAVRFVRKQRNA
jgi:hypothetical protein